MRIFHSECEIFASNSLCEVNISDLCIKMVKIAHEIAQKYANSHLKLFPDIITEYVIHIYRYAGKVPVNITSKQGRIQDFGKRGVRVTVKY